MAFIPLLLAVLAAAAHVSATCNADNCYRGLSGSAHAASATAFCGSYMAPSFTGTIPTYASACSNSAVRLSSACNCLTAAAIATTTSSSSSASVSSTSSSTTAAASSTTSTTVTSSSSTGVSTTLSTSVTTAGSTCKVTRTHTVLTTTTSTVLETYSPYPINVLVDGGFEYRSEYWAFNNGIPVRDSVDTPAHSGDYSAQLNAVGPTLPDGSDAQDASVNARAVSGNDAVTGAPNPGGNFLLSMYVYLVSVTSTDDTEPSCELTVLIGGQEVVSLNVVPETIRNQYYPVYQWVDVDNTESVVVDLSCSLSSDVGQYSATALVDDVYLFSGPYVQCGAQQR